MDSSAQVLKVPGQPEAQGGADAASSNEEAGPKASAKSIPSRNIIPQFINYTDSVSLDESARTQVRVQVMRDYHRRRAQRGEGKEEVLVSDTRNREPPTAKSQTQKFRLGHEKVLRPWVPVRTPASKRMNDSTAAERVSKKAVRATRKQPPQNAQSGWLENEKGNKPQPALVMVDGTTQVQDGQATQEPLDQWLSLLKLALQSSALRSSPDSGSLDPFSTTALLITPRTQLLLHNYFNVRLRSAWLMMPMRKSAFSRAIHDMALFHAFMSHYATYSNVRFKTGDSAESTFHITMAARLVNERLADPAQALTDETIATVACLGAYESTNGTKESMLVHMDGLEKMVQMRGGLLDGGFPAIVQRLIGWTDYHVATALQRKARFPPLRFAETDEPESTSPLQPQTAPHSRNTHTQTHPTPRLGTLFTSLGKLSNTLREFRLRPCMPQENVWYNDKIYHLQRNLFDLAYSDDQHPQHRPLDSVCALAGLIYCARYLRDVPFSYAIQASAVTRLKAAIEQHESAHVWKAERGDSEKMYWILGFGGIAAEAKAEHAWFVRRFAEVGKEMMVGSWEETRMVFVEVLWQEELDDAGARLWEQAQALGNPTGISERTEQ